MGFRCSLLGHEYGEPTEREERAERGNEVVVTVREIRECARCGGETVISENTEVTSLGHGADADDSGAADAARSGQSADESTADDAGPGGQSADEPDESPAEEVVEAAEPTEPGRPTDDVAADASETATADEDDGVILDETDEVDRDRQQWPDATDTRLDEPEPTGDDAGGVLDDEATWPDPGRDGDSPTGDRAAERAAPDDDGAWPEPEGEDEGFSAARSDDEVDVEFGGGLTPDIGESEGDDDTEYVSSGGGSGITRTGPLEPTADLDTVLVCPECGFSEDSMASSLRAGDICPEPDCGRGYLTERER